MGRSRTGLDSYLSNGLLGYYDPTFNVSSDLDKTIYRNSCYIRLCQM